MTNLETIRAPQHFERPVRSTGEWERREREMQAEIDAFRQIAGDQETKLTKAGWDREEEAEGWKAAIADVKSAAIGWKIATYALASVWLVTIGGLWSML
jgi:hypothetical protein